MTTTSDSMVTTDALAADAPRPGSRADRATQPRARDVLQDTAVEFGVCVRPVAMRRVDLATGETEIKDIPCGATRAAVCPSCARRSRRLRAQQAREGWHLTEDPDLTPRPGTPSQRDLVRERAQITEAVEDAADAGDDLTAQACQESAETVDDELAASGVRGKLLPSTTPRRARSTRRRQDAPDLPKRPSNGSTVGRTYVDERTGRTFRPSLFVTLTLPSYGPVRRDDSTPLDPRRYDYRRAARDALHFGKLLDRWCQNLRRVAGYDVQYFAVVESQKRAAPHAHFAIRGTLPRALVKQLTAATYAHVWWPSTREIVYPEGCEPRWDPALHEDGGFVDPVTGQPLPTWEEALDDLEPDPDDAAAGEPYHVVRFGQQVDVKGVMAGSAQAEQCIGYLVKYLVHDLGTDLDVSPTKHTHKHAEPHAGEELVPADVEAARARRDDHVARLVDALRWEPCSSSCPNWLRYGIEPKNPRPSMRAGCCRAKAHKPSHLGYGGRRVLVSRKWTTKDLADHRHDRRAHVLAVLSGTPDGHPADSDGSSTTTPPDAVPDTGPVLWELAKQTDPDVPPLSHRLLRSIAHATRSRAEYRTARDGTPCGRSSPTSDLDPAA